MKIETKFKDSNESSNWSKRESQKDGQSLSKHTCRFYKISVETTNCKHIFCNCKTRMKVSVPKCDSNASEDQIHMVVRKDHQITCFHRSKQIFRLNGP